MIWKVLLIISLIMNVWNFEGHRRAAKVLRMMYELLEKENLI